MLQLMMSVQHIQFESGVVVSGKFGQSGPIIVRHGETKRHLQVSFGLRGWGVVLEDCCRHA